MTVAHQTEALPRRLHRGRLPEDGFLGPEQAGQGLPPSRELLHGPGEQVQQPDQK